MSLAGTGEIVVSRTVRDLVIGSELTFTDRGQHELKGVPDHWALYAVAQASPALPHPFEEAWAGLSDHGKRQ